MSVAELNWSRYYSRNGKIIVRALPIVWVEPANRYVEISDGTSEQRWLPDGGASSIMGRNVGDYAVESEDGYKWIFSDEEVQASFDKLP
jgi:hypothetical protein